MVSQLQVPTTPAKFPVQLAGSVQVFTTVHRSFFTEVIAQAIRLANQGTSVLVIQFLKGGIGQGPQKPVRLGERLDWIRCALPRCVDTPDLEAEELEALAELWQHTQLVVSQGQYSLVVLDELSLAIHLGLIPVQDVLELIQQRPAPVDVILTGPEMPASLLELADQVTTIRRPQG